MASSMLQNLRTIEPIILNENVVDNLFSHIIRLFNPLNADLNSIYHLLALVGAHHIFHISRVRVNAVTLRHAYYIVCLVHFPEF
jgi:hypothetical protein